MERDMVATFVLDRAVILERLGGDEEIFTMMVDMFLQDVDNNCSKLEEALQSTDPKALLREAHTVKGLLATFSDDAGADMAHVLEQRLKHGGSGDSAAEVAALSARLREVAAVLRQA
jgi:histidine phosphotransfer protein HptB